MSKQLEQIKRLFCYSCKEYTDWLYYAKKKRTVMHYGHTCQKCGGSATASKDLIEIFEKKKRQ